ncbi:MAG: translation initiation factor IF-2 [Deltaproteobacteria bacterium]|nr:translation initiation factor IF-2 [Deltaproteobacteria bacterium]
MAKMRVYELARELGVENKEVVAKARELGFLQKGSHSSSLESEEAELLRRAFIRAAIGTSPDSEVITTCVDERTGEQRTVVESRKGNIVRRRRRVVEEPVEVEASAPEQPEEVPPPLSEEPVQAQEPSEVEVPVESAEVVEEPQQLEEASPPVEEESAGDLPEASVEEAPREEAKKTVGPKILGRIQLPQKKAKVERTVRPEPVWDSPGIAAVADDDEEEGGKHGGKRRKTRKREFSRGDLIDYEGRPTRRLRTEGRGRGRDGASADRDEGAREVMPQKASKRVIRMSGDVITVGELSRQMSLKAGEVISKLMSLGVMATINQAIDKDTAAIVADECDFTIEFTGFDEDLILARESSSEAVQLEKRPPVVTVMGHVDHGKTSLLDCIRKTTVAAKEHGGITQHIGAYQVRLDQDRIITFIDTPGHAAFTAMRARGAQVTDVVVLVVAADDGVMPQTVEALNHAKAAGVPIVVAMNKMDKPTANPDRIRQQLAERGVQPEEWGGDTIFLGVSALNGQGVPELLEAILLVAEMKELKADVLGRARGIIVEARQERGRGVVATVLIQQGNLKIGDVFVSGAESGRVRSMLSDLGTRLESAGPSVPVEITGFSGVPFAGDDFAVVASENEAKQVADNRRAILTLKDQLALAGGPVSLEEFSRRATEQQAAELNLILKADVHGSLEAVRQAVEGLSGEKVKVRVLHGAVGAVNESDVQLAIASRAIVIGFGVRGEPRALNEAESYGIEVRFYRIIYELLDEVKQAMAGLLAPIKKEVSLGHAEVRDTFSVPKVGTVAGCYVLDGTVKRGALLRLVRDSRVVHEGRMLALRRFKDDVKEVQSGYECGISFDGYNDVKLGDLIEAFEIKEIAATID